jgi:hypothetical protein
MYTMYYFIEVHVYNVFLNWSTCTCIQCIPLLKYMYTMYSFTEVHVYNVFLYWSTCIQCIPLLKYMYTMYSLTEVPVHVYNVFLYWSTCIQCMPLHFTGMILIANKIKRKLMKNDWNHLHVHLLSKGPFLTCFDYICPATFRFYGKKV